MSYNEWRRLPKPTKKQLQKATPSGGQGALPDYKKASEKYEAIYMTATEVLGEMNKGVPATVIKWKPLDKEGRAQGLIADPLTVNGPKGTGPGEAIPGWDTNLEYGNEKIAFVRGHESIERVGILAHDKLGEEFNVLIRLRQLVVGRERKQHLVTHALGRCRP